MSQASALNRHYHSTRAERPLVEVSKPSSSRGKCLSVALGVILLIGSLIAAGLLYQQLGYFSLAIAGVGVVLSLVSFVLSGYCGSPETVKSEHPTPLPSKPEVVKALKPQSKPGRTLEIKGEVPPSKAEEKKPQPVLPPLPFIFDLQKLGSSPLLQPLPREAFLRIDGDGNVRPFILASMLVGTQEAKGLIDSSDLDDELLDLPLHDWFKSQDRLCSSSFAAKVCSHPRRKQRVALINERIKVLNSTVQLQERLQRLDIPDVTIEDLLPAWPHSPLRLMLMLDDELMQLKVSSVKHMNPILIRQFLGRRICALAKKKAEFCLPPVLSEESVDDLLLIDLPKLNAHQINANANHFPPITFLLLPVSQLQQIATARLSTYQLHCIFETTCLNKLRPSQVNACISLVQNKKIFADLNKEQLLQLDYSKVDREIFEAIFKDHPKRLKKLNFQQLQQLCDFFSDRHWKIVGKEHADKFDLQQVESLKRKEVFSALFSPRGRRKSNAAKHLPKLDLNKIYTLIPLFSPNHWKYIGEKHVIHFNFLKIEDEALRSMAVKTIFDPRQGSRSPAAKLLPDLNPDQIKVIKPFLDPAALKYLPHS